MANIEYSEQEILRRESMDKLRELGINPYPAPLYPVNATTKDILDGYDPEKGNFQDVCIAGRIMSRRIMGAASFMELQDEAGRIQVYVKRDEICPEDTQVATDGYQSVVLAQMGVREPEVVVELKNHHSNLNNTNYHKLNTNFP